MKQTATKTHTQIVENRQQAPQRSFIIKCSELIFRHWTHSPFVHTRTHVRNRRRFPTSSTTWTCTEQKKKMPSSDVVARCFNRESSANNVHSKKETKRKTTTNVDDDDGAQRARRTCVRWMVTLLSFALIYFYHHRAQFVRFRK